MHTQLVPQRRDRELDGSPISAMPMSFMAWNVANARCRTFENPALAYRPVLDHLKCYRETLACSRPLRGPLQPICMGRTERTSQRLRIRLSGALTKQAQHGSAKR